MKMRVWTNKTFKGHWPVGSAAVVVAEFATDAAEYLESALAENGLHQDINASDMIQLKMEDGEWMILCDGEY